MKRAALFVTLVAVLGAACQKSAETTAPASPPPTTSTTRVTGNTAAVPEHANAARADPLRHPLFWSVEKDGKTTYFLGTMHLGIDAQSRLPAIVWSKLDAANTFAMEADLDDPAAAALIKASATSLRQALGDDYWKKLEDAMGPSVARAVDHLPPMVSASALSMRGLPRTLPMDRTLAERAASLHKQLVFLEPTSRQLAILGKWMDVKAVKMMLDELPQSEQHARAMLDAYVAGDEQKMVALSDSEKDDALHHGYTAAEYDQEMNEVLYQRSSSWIDELEQLHAGGGGFVAVGALHLIGPRSVLDLLAHKGYRVTRIAP